MYNKLLLIVVVAKIFITLAGEYHHEVITFQMHVKTVKYQILSSAKYGPYCTNFFNALYSYTSTLHTILLQYSCLQYTSLHLHCTTLQNNTIVAYNAFYCHYI